MHCIVSYFKKYFMATQLSSLNLDSFIFHLRQWALESQGVSGYLKTLIFGPETSKLRLKSLPRVFFSKQEEKTAKSKFDKRTDFLWFKSWLFVCLNCSSVLHLWYPAQTAVFFICLEINMTSYVKNYFWSKYYLLSEFGRSWNVLKNVAQSFFKLFLNFFFLMMDVKLLQPCACVENFHGNWRIISCPIAQLSFFFMSDGNFDELFEDLCPIIGT